MRQRAETRAAFAANGAARLAEAVGHGESVGPFTRPLLGLFAGLVWEALASASEAQPKAERLAVPAGVVAGGVPGTDGESGPGRAGAAGEHSQDRSGEPDRLTDTAAAWREAWDAHGACVEHAMLRAPEGDHATHLLHHLEDCLRGVALAEANAQRRERWGEFENAARVEALASLAVAASALTELSDECQREAQYGTLRRHEVTRMAVEHVSLARDALRGG